MEESRKQGSASGGRFLSSQRTTSKSSDSDTNSSRDSSASESPGDRREYAMVRGISIAIGKICQIGGGA